MKKVFGLALAFVLMLVSLSLAIAGEKVVYTVKSGDTLGELMFTWKVQGVDIKRIHKWNPALGTQVSIGQQIEYYLPDQPASQKISAAEIKKIVDETIAAQRRNYVAPMPTADYRPVSYLLASILATMIFATMVFLFLRGSKQKVISEFQPQPQKMAEPTKTAESTQPTTKWVEVDGYSVKIEIDNVDGEKRFYSPFTTSGLTIYAPSESKMMSSLRRCLKPDSKFSGQVKSLQEEGSIKPLK